MSRCQKCFKQFKKIDDIHLVIALGGKMGFPVCLECKQKHYPDSKEFED